MVITGQPSVTQTLLYLSSFTSQFVEVFVELTKEYSIKKLI